MERISIGGTVLWWFKSYLAHRKQVKFGRRTSESLYIEGGSAVNNVRPSFICIINGRVKCIKHCKRATFVDDTMLYINGSGSNSWVGKQRPSECI